MLNMYFPIEYRAWTRCAVESILDRFVEYASNLATTDIVLLVGYIRGGKRNDYILKINKEMKGNRK